MNLIPKSIILTVYNKNASSYAVTWQTEDEGSPVLEYRLKGEDSFSLIKGQTSESIGCVKNFAVIQNLSFNTEYEYRVGDESGIRSELFSFRTVRGLDDEVAFYYFADSQDDEHLGEWWKPCWQHAEKSFPEVDFVMHGGDMVQQSGRQDLWDAMLGINKELVAKVPFIASCGNHDYWRGYLHGYLHTFHKHVSYDIPEQNTEDGIFYSCVTSDVHFIVLNSGTDFAPESEQYKWLVNELENSRTKWRIVLIHNPLYSPGKYGSRPGLNDLALALRKVMNPLFAKHRVDMVFSGHDHVYSKSYPILADGTAQKDYEYETRDILGESVKTAINPRGPVHFVTGPAGDQFRTCHDDVDTSYFSDLDEYEDTLYAHVGYSYVRIKGDTLTLIYKMVSVETGEAVMTKSFAIKK